MTNRIIRQRLPAPRVSKPKHRHGSGVRKILGALGLIVASVAFCSGQAKPPAAKAPHVPARVQAGATFRVADQALRNPLTIIAYGDMRFTDPTNFTATNPSVRQALVARIAEDNPDALLLNGDVPWHGSNSEDYSVYKSETRPWRVAHLRVYPALGNHEFADCDPEQCLANWWHTFPELQGRRWYSVQLGSEIYAIALDSDTSLLPQSPQARWLEAQIASLPATVKFVLIAMHHPPVADVQTKMFVDHNPRENEIALSNFLEANRKRSVKFVVIAGHIHNYERFEQNGVVYLVSGGGGAVPYPVERTPGDAYQDASFPNYHYLKFVLAGDALKATMFRLADPNTLKWEAKDTFEVRAAKTKD
jgi:calcineurin-like phosphoesterase family protein